MTAIRVAVFGAGGKMGSEVCRAVVAAGDMELVAAVDPEASGRSVESVNGAPCDVQIASDPSPVSASDADVAIDFTFAEVGRENLAWLAEHGIHAVSGTTGFSESDLDAFRSGFRDSNCVIAPNFAIGAVLMMRFAEMAAPFFDTAEIIELHHNNKRDAPSGTAMHTADRMAAASQTWESDPTEQEVIAGARGADGPGGIRMHSVRLNGLVAHQEVLLGTTGQTLSLRHDSIDRSSFMPGVLMATRAVRSRPGLTVGLEDLLGL